MKKIIAAVAALALMTPFAAAAEPARTGSSIEEAEGISGPTLTALLAAAAIIAGVVIFADGDDETPVSA